MTGGTLPEVVLDIGPQSMQSFNLDGPLREARDEFEKSYFEYHLARESGSMTRVAEKTGLERTHLYRKAQAVGRGFGAQQTQRALSSAPETRSKKLLQSRFCLAR